MGWLLAHLVGDFLIQTDWMAAGKKKKSWICLVHVLTYLLPFLLLLPLLWWQLVLIGVQHFLQDRWGFVVWVMKKTGHGNFANPPMSPWSIIVTDNIIHLLWIYLVIYLGGI